MKKILPLLIIMLIGTASFAQDCYNSTRNKAIDLFNQGKKAQAKSYFEAAKDCPDKPANNDLDTWIKKCDGDITPVPKTEKITVESVALINPSGLTSALTNVNYYTDEFLNLVPKLVIDNGSKSNTKRKIGITITDPEGNKLTSSDGGQYTETKEVQLKPGHNEVFFSSIGSFANTPKVGDYTCEVWIGNKQAKETSWLVSTRSTTLVINGKTSAFDVTLDCNGGSYTFNVTTNADGFEAKHKPSWVTIGQTSHNSLTISYSANPSHSPRNGKMDIYTSDGRRFININLIQDGNPAFASKFGDRMFKDMKIKVGLGFGLPNFTAKSSTELGSVIDYGVTDVPSLAYLEIPEYKTLAGFSLAVGLDMPLTKDIFLETGIGLQHFGVKNVFDNTQLRYTVSGIAYHLEYGCTENYRMTYLQIPLLAGTKVPINSVSSIRFAAGLDIGIGLAAKCRLDEGYSNYSYSSGGSSYIGNSTYSGEVNLYSGKFEIKQQYTTGQQPSFNYAGRKTVPYKRLNLGLHLGASYDFGSLEVGASYTLGLSNIGNTQYFQSTNRVGGCLFVGEVISSEQGIYNYKQRVNNFQVFLNYWL